MKIRYWFIAIFALALLAATLLRMGQLAGTGGDALRQEALRVAEVRGELAAIRGRILAADGTPLAWSVRRYDLTVAADASPDGIAAARSCVETLFGANWGRWQDAEPGAVIKYNLTLRELELADELCQTCRSLEICLAWERLHSEEADVKVLGKVRQENGMEIGVSGLEADFEETLRGRPGVFCVMADREGRWLDGTFRMEREAEAGTDLVLEAEEEEESEAEIPAGEGAR